MDSTGLSSAAAALWAPSSATTCLLSSTAIPLVFTSCAAVSSSPSPASPSLSSPKETHPTDVSPHGSIDRQIEYHPIPSAKPHASQRARSSEIVSICLLLAGVFIVPFLPSFHTEHDEPTCSRRLGTAFVPSNSPRPFDRCVTPVANSHVD